MNQPFKLRYTPDAQDDLDSIWLDVLNASSMPDVASQYISDLMDAVSEKKVFPASGIPLFYRGLFTGFYQNRA